MIKRALREFLKPFISLNRSVSLSPPCAFAGQTSAAKDERLVSLSVVSGADEKAMFPALVFGMAAVMGARVWICDLH